MILAGGRLCQDGLDAPSTRLQAFCSHQLINLSFTSKVLIMRLLSGFWKENERAFSFRRDSNWLGFSKCADTDVVTGWCESGNIFIADVRQLSGGERSPSHDVRELRKPPSRQ